MIAKREDSSYHGTINATHVSQLRKRWRVSPVNMSDKVVLNTKKQTKAKNNKNTSTTGDEHFRECLIPSSIAVFSRA